MVPERPAKFLTAAPFRPFIVHIGDGRSLEVTHPELAVLVGDKGRSLLMTAADDSSHLIDVLLITGIEVTSGREWNGMIDVIS
jgi:hypothetical protein